MKPQFKKLLPAALTAIQDEFGTGKISREHQAYISAMGATIQQMGLLPTLAIYADEESGAKADRRKLLKILQRILTDDACGLEQEIKNVLNDDNYASGKLFHAAAEGLNDRSQRRQLKRHLLDAAVATKLAIRTFKLSKT